MKLLLLSGANPRVSSGGPRVKLHAGVWKIVSDAVDSLLSVTHDQELTITESEIVQVQFIKRGTERQVSIFAELVP